MGLPTSSKVSEVTNVIHETAYIGPGVNMGTGNTFGPMCVILGPCTIGSDNWFAPHVSIGSPGEIRGAPHPATWANEESSTSLIIGDRNVFREFSVIHGGEFRGTSIGSDCYIMNNCYIAHDCQIEDFVTISGSVMMGGHSTIQSASNLGMNCTVHQKTVIGCLAMVGMSAVVTHHLPPFSLAYGSPARVHGVNKVGMQRASIPETEILKVEKFLMGGDLAELGIVRPIETKAFLQAREESGRRH
jgi:UDP-N-acetylglucosamine acyltransferase